MTDTGIFKHIWRLNALLVLAVGAYVVTMLINDLDLGSSPANTHYGRSNPVAGEPMALGPVRQIDNTPHFVRTYRPAGKHHTMASLGADVIYNMLFIDGTTNTHRWLIGDRNVPIYDWRVIDVPGPLGDQRPVAVMYRSVPEDTNGDGVCGRGDDETIFVSDIDGGNLRTLLSGVSHRALVEVVGDHLFCSYRKSGKSITAIYELLPALKVITEVELPEHPAQDQAGEG